MLTILRTRLMQVAKREHHATRAWSYSKPVREKYPWEHLAVSWAYTARGLNYRGDSVPGGKVLAMLNSECFEAYACCSIGDSSGDANLIRL
jgi:hypothetical protein